MLENPKVAKNLVYDYKGLKIAFRNATLICLRCWQNNKKIG